MGAPVVVVDDDDDIAALLLMALKRSDVAAVRAADGGEAVDTIVRERPAVVLLDWMMPVKDGVEVCREIRSMSDLAQPHIIMLTAKSHPDELARALEAGIDEAIAKPFRAREVVGKVQAILGQTG